MPGNDVLGRVARRVDPAAPRFAVSGPERQLEFERLPIRVQDGMHEVPGEALTVKASECDDCSSRGWRSLTPCHSFGAWRIRCVRLRAAPRLDIVAVLPKLVERVTNRWTSACFRAVPSRTSSARRRDSRRCCYRAGCAALRRPWGAWASHARAAQREKIPDLPAAQLLHGRVVGRAFDATIPAAVVVRAVAVVLAIGLIVLDVVGDEVIEREAVVAGDEVDALLGLALLMTVDFGAAEHAVGDGAPMPSSPLHETADIIAETAVPLLPASPMKLPDLVQPAASHASAISFVPASTGSDSMSHRIGGLRMGLPDSSRARIDARSNRNPSTCICCDPVRRLSRSVGVTTGWLAFNVLPVPL